MEKLSTSFSTSKYTDSALRAKADYVIDKMTGNSYFPEPNPSLIEIRTANNEFADSITKVPGVHGEGTVYKNRKRAELVALLKKEVLYVESIANGDEMILRSSGFDLTKSKHTPVGILDAPEDLAVLVSQVKGVLDISFKPVLHARHYELEYKVKGETEVHHKVWTRTKDELQELISGVEYEIRVCAAATDPGRRWSKWVSSFVI